METEGKPVDVGSLEESIKRVVCVEDSAGNQIVELEKTSSVVESDFCVLEAEKVVTVVDADEKNVDNLEQEDANEADADSKPAPVSEDAAENPASDSDSEDDLQLIVNDEDIYGVEGVEEVETEDLYAVAAADERYEDMNWSADMQYHHSQFKYVRPGAGPATAGQSPGVQQEVNPAAKGQQPVPGRGGPMPFVPYMMNQWAFQPCYEFTLPPSRTVFDIDLDQFEEKPWTYPGVDITDYFNFDFTEESWKQYCEDLARLESETPVKGRNRPYENGYQSYVDQDMYNMPPQRLRSRGSRGQLSGRAIQVDGGSMERRPSADTRRQRHRDSSSVIQIPLEDGDNDGFRRRRRNEEPYSVRRRDFSRQHDQMSSGGRRGAFSHGGEAYGSPPRGRALMRRVSDPSNNGYGSTRQPMDNSARSYDRRKPQPSRGRRNYSDEPEEDGGSYGSSDSRGSYPHEKSEDEYMDNRVPNQMRSVADGESRDREMSSWRADRRIISSGHQISEKKTEESSSQALTERRRSWQVLSEKRLGRLPAGDDEPSDSPKAETPVERRRSLPSMERKSAQVERRSQSERKTLFTSAPRDPSPEKPVVKRLTRAERIEEKRRAQMIALQKLEQEKSLEAAAAIAATAEASTVKTTKVVTIKKTAEPQQQPRFKRQENAGKDDLRMKVVDIVNEKWKMHLRMDGDKRKRDKTSVPGRAKLERQADIDVLEAGTREGRDEYYQESQADDHIEDYETGRVESRRARKRKEKREERKQRHRERAEQEISYVKDYDPDPEDDRVMDDERWREPNEAEEAERGYTSSKSHRKNKKRRRESDEGYYRYEVEEDDEEDGEVEFARKRSRSRSRRRHRDDYNGDVMEEEHPRDYMEDEFDRWNGYEESSGQRSNKRRRYKDDEINDYDYANAGDYSMSAEDDVYYKDRDRQHYDEQPAGRWTGSLHESDEDDEYDRFQS